VPRKSSWADTSPQKVFVRTRFFEALPVSRQLPHPANQASPSSCRRPQADHLLRDCITVTRAKTTISSKSLAPISKRENHVVLLSGHLSLTEVFRECPASRQTPWTDSPIVELFGTIRLLRQTLKGKKQGNDERFQTPTIYTI
jgi:hypothetical protein